MNEENPLRLETFPSIKVVFCVDPEAVILHLRPTCMGSSNTRISGVYGFFSQESDAFFNIEFQELFQVAFILERIHWSEARLFSSGNDAPQSLHHVRVPRTINKRNKSIAYPVKVKIKC